MDPSPTGAGIGRRPDSRGSPVSIPSFRRKGDHNEHKEINTPESLFRPKLLRGKGTGGPRVLKGEVVYSSRNGHDPTFVDLRPCPGRV